MESRAETARLGPGFTVAAERHRRPRRRRGAQQRHARPELEVRALRHDAAARLRGRPAEGDQARLWLVVDVEEAGLPTVQVGLVDRVEDQERSDGRLAERELDRLAVVLSLNVLRHRLDRRRLYPGVEARLGRRDLRLDAELGVVDRQGASSLRRPVERGAENGHELVVVGNRDRARVWVAAVDGSHARVVLVRVDRKRVHYREAAVTRAIGGAHVLDERRRRVRRPDRIRNVFPARRDGATEDDDLRGDLLQRVVRFREQRLVCRRRCVGAVRVELRQPPAVEVRFVPDDEVADLGQGARQRGRIRGELIARLLRQRRGAITKVRDGEHDRHAVELGRVDDVCQRVEVLRVGLRLSRRPHLAHAHGVESGEAQQVHLRLCADERRLADRVLGRADQHRRTARGRLSGQRESHEDEREKPFHDTKVAADTLIQMANRLEEQLRALPTKPGVYLFRDGKGEVLYIGKAKSLRSRVRSYFQESLDSRAAIRQLPERVEDVEVIVTSTQAEALHLEQNLVNRFRPPFNVRLRDDKFFPYIAVTVEDEYPRVMFTRERHRRGVVYFGPYANAKKVRDPLDALTRVSPSRPCEGPNPGRHSGIPCLDFHIDRCLAPCVGYVSREDYRAIIDQVIEFLSGETRPILRRLEEKMRNAAAAERFEEAARYRNRLFSVQHLAERQAADKRAVGTIDVLGLAVDEDRATVQVFPLRDGKLIDRYSFHLENVAGQDRASLLETFCLEYYGSSPSVPPQIVVPRDAGDTSALEEFLSERRGSRVEVRAAERGEKRRLQELAEQNARLALESEAGEVAATPNLVVVDGGKGQLSAALAAMQAFDLPRVAVIALAKRVEEVFLPGRPEPVVLDPHSPGLQLLQRIRDEAHRFAIGFHRQRRDTRSFGSIFDDLEGVGPARRRAILQHFGSAERFLAATQEELEGVPGVPAKTARSIYAQLHKAGRA